MVISFSYKSLRANRVSEVLGATRPNAFKVSLSDERRKRYTLTTPPPRMPCCTVDAGRLLLMLIAAICICLATTTGRPAWAQGVGPLQLRAESFLAGSTSERLPFWLAANQRGTVDPTSANAGLRLGAYRPFGESPGLEYGFGADVLGRASQNGTVTVHQLYGQLRYWKLQLTAGRREQIVGRVDSSLSLGSVVRSRNAPPIPRVSIASDGYLSIPGTGEGLAVQGHLAHGWFGSDRFTSGALLHEKSFYLRLLPPDAPITAHAGLVHHAVWGGTSPLRGPQEASPQQWAEVAFGLNILTRSTQTQEQLDQEDANHVAMYDFSLDVDLGGVEGLVYRQFYLEDLPAFRFRNVWDGLWGARLQLEDSEALVHTVLWEHLRTTRQGARFDQGERRGADGYYNHFKYKGGWTYRGRTLGTPLLTPASGTPGLANNLPGIGNNIVVAHHAGVEGHLGAGLSYRVLGTYSRNYGAANKICETPRCESTTSRLIGRQDQWSFRLGVRGPLLRRHNLQFQVAAALDTGAFYDERVGLRLGVRWRGLYAPGRSSASR